MVQREGDYKSIFEDSPNPMWVFDVGTLQILAVNNMALADYGYSREEFLSMNIKQLRPEQEEEKLLQILTATDREKSYKGRVLHKKKHGDLFYVDIFTQPTVFAEKKARIVSVIDVDEKQKADEQILQLTEKLKKKKGYLSSLLDSQSNYLIRTGLEGNYTFVNKTFCRKFGYREEELLGKLYFTAVVPQDHEKLQLAAKECIANPGRVVSLKLASPNKKGEVLMSSWEFVAIRNAAGEVVEMQGVGQDVTQEHQYHQELKETKERLENILSSIHDIVWSIRADDFSLLYISPACLAITGYSQQEFYQDNQLLINITHPLDKERLRAGIPDFFSKGKEEYELRIIHKDGSIRYINRKMILIRDEEGKPSVITGISSDITTKKIAEAKERENTKIREEILESITDGFFAVDKDWNFTYINKEFERVLKVKREDLIGESVWQHFSEAVNRKFYSEYHRAVTENISVRFEEYLLSLNIWFKVSAYPIQDGLAVYFQDISKEKTLELEVERSERNLSALINNTEDLVWSVDANLRLLSFNSPYQQRIKVLTGKNIKIGDNVLMTTDFEKQSYEKWQAYYKKALAGKRFRVAEQYFIAAEIMYAEISFNTIISQCRIIGVSCFARDITESKKYEDKLKQHNQLLSEIAHTQSHGLRRPVATIMGLIGLFDKQNLSSDLNALLVDKIEIVCQELDAVIHKVVEKTYELEEKKDNL